MGGAPRKQCVPPQDWVGESHLGWGPTPRAAAGGSGGGGGLLERLPVVVEKEHCGADHDAESQCHTGKFQPPALHHGRQASPSVLRRRRCDLWNLPHLRCTASRREPRQGDFNPSMLGSEHGILLGIHEKSGHRGADAVYAATSLRFYWPSMRAHVRHHVASCHACQIRSMVKPQVPLHISMPSTIWVCSTCVERE